MWGGGVSNGDKRKTNNNNNNNKTFLNWTVKNDVQIFGIDPLFKQQTVILQSNLWTAHMTEKDKQDTGEGYNIPNSYERCERIVLMFINREYEKR